MIYQDPGLHLGLKFFFAPFFLLPVDVIAKLLPASHVLWNVCELIREDYFKESRSASIIMSHDQARESLFKGRSMIDKDYQIPANLAPIIPHPWPEVQDWESNRALEIFCPEWLEVADANAVLLHVHDTIYK